MAFWRNKDATITSRVCREQCTNTWPMGTGCNLSQPGGERAGWDTVTGWLILWSLAWPTWINLTHWVRAKPSAIFQTIFWNAFAWMGAFEIQQHWYGSVTMIVPASGHQVRCIPRVQMGTFNKEIGFLCGFRFFALNISSGEYLQSSLRLMLQIWWKPLLWKMCQ